MQAGTSPPVTAARAAPPTRAARREMTRETIRVAARTRLQTHGPNGVAMRAIARIIGMPASSLYRFYADRAALMTDLRVSAYEAMINDLAIARDSGDPWDFGDQWRNIARALRRWALRNPDEFGLLYGAQVSGDDEWTEPVFAQRARAGALVGAVIAEAIRVGQLDPQTPGDSVKPDDPAWVAADGVCLGPVVVQLTMGGWSAIVGHISLEARRKTMIADPRQHYEEYLNAVMIGMGFTEPRHAAASRGDDRSS